MKCRVLALLLALVGLTHPAQACGNRHRCRVAAPRIMAYQAPAAAPVAWATAAPQAPSPVTVVAAPPPAIAGELPPALDFPTQAAGQSAYYYTFDESGKPVIRQWMDWVFRGGREAGMPRPPLPIVGRLGAR